MEAGKFRLSMFFTYKLRILQKFFPKANQDEVDLIIHEIQDKLEELMLDPYANYMFQTLAQSCSSDQRYFLLKKISPSMVEIACDRKGTHALQSLIALVSRDAEENLLKDTLKDHIVELSFVKKFAGFLFDLNA